MRGFDHQYFLVISRSDRQTTVEIGYRWRRSWRSTIVRHTLARNSKVHIAELGIGKLSSGRPPGSGQNDLSIHFGHCIGAVWQPGCTPVQWHGCWDPCRLKQNNGPGSNRVRWHGSAFVLAHVGGAAVTFELMICCWPGGLWHKRSSVAGDTIGHRPGIVVEDDTGRNWSVIL